MSKLTLLLLGTPRIERNGTPIDVDTRKAIALLAYLAITRQMHSRETLATLFWPDTLEARARLRRTLSVLYSALARSWLDIERETIRLEQSSQLSVDVDQFHHLLEAWRGHGHTAEEICPTCIANLKEATELYRGDFMAGFTLRDSPAFDEWQIFQTERLRREMMTALERLTRGYTVYQEFDLAIHTAQKWLALDPLDETGHQLLMRVYNWDGQRVAALRQYQECVRLLEEELGVPPTKETTLLYEKIRDGEEIEGVEQFTSQPKVWGHTPAVAASTPAVLPTLPLPITPFFGRTAELTELSQLLSKPECRLLTIVGLGGSGKTRLALQCAHHLQAQFSDGVYFVPLEAVQQSEFLATAILQALDVPVRGKNSPQQQVTQALHGKNLLLVLDNMEQLAGQSSWLGELLKQAAGFKLLVTSRERLNLQGEWLFPLAGMDFPADKQADPAGYSAGQLFTQRAQTVLHSFQPTPAEQQAIATICQQLDGLPLAIELAAGWVGMISCVEIAQEIQKSLDLLTTTVQDVPERHRSIRALFDASWHYLTPAEQIALQKLAVFWGGFDRQAAGEIAQASLPLLLSLSHKALLQRVNEQFFAMHPLLKQYVLEKLPPAEWETLQQTHAFYYAQFVAQQRAHTYRLEIWRQFEPRLENIRQAWQWGVAHQQEAVLQQLLEPLYDFYESRTWYAEGTQLLEEAYQQLAHQKGISPLFYRRLQARVGSFYFRVGKFALGEELLKPCLEFFRPLGYPADVAFVCSGLGKLAYGLGRYSESEQYQREAWQIYLGLGHPAGVAAALHNLGLALSSLSRYQEAAHFYQESLAVKLEIEDKSSAALTLVSLSAVEFSLGRYEQTRQYCLEGLALAEQFNNLYVAGLALNNLGLLAKQEGDYEQASHYYQTGRAHFRSIGFRVGMAGVTLNLGRVISLQKKYAEAQEQYQIALQLFQEIGDQSGIALCWQNLGLIALQQKNYEVALEYYQKSLELHRQVEDLEEVASVLVCIGEIWLIKGEKIEAENCLNEALNIGQTTQSPPTLLDVLIGFAHFYLQKNEPAAGVALLHTVLAHSACTTQMQQKITEMSEQFKLEIEPNPAGVLSLEKTVEQLLNR
jgi:predicted ATPase/DNA-binding SARP family transcriptional activator